MAAIEAPKLVTERRITSQSERFYRDKYITVVFDSNFLSVSFHCPPILCFLRRDEDPMSNELKKILS